MLGRVFFCIVVLIVVIVVAVVAAVVVFVVVVVVVVAVVAAAVLVLVLVRVLVLVLVVVLVVVVGGGAAEPLPKFFKNSAGRRPRICQNCKKIVSRSSGAAKMRSREVPVPGGCPRERRGVDFGPPRHHFGYHFGAIFGMFWHTFL